MQGDFTAEIAERKRGGERMEKGAKTNRSADDAD
jgi:hypothetical protein